MAKKVTYYEDGMPELCPECAAPIEDGDECYYHGDGVYTCSAECAKKFEE